jgi:hypothetical protein
VDPDRIITDHARTPFFWSFDRVALDRSITPALRPVPEILLAAGEHIKRMLERSYETA